MMNTDEYIYRVKRTDKRTAWRLFKYFRFTASFYSARKIKSYTKTQEKLLSIISA